MAADTARRIPATNVRSSNPGEVFWHIFHRREIMLGDLINCWGIEKQSAEDKVIRALERGSIAQEN